MNILQLCNKPPYPAKDGGSIAISAMSQGFADLGHEVFILAINTPKHFTTEEAIKPWLPKNTIAKLVYVDTRVKVFKALRNFLFSNKPYHLARFYSKRFERELSSLLQHNKFDVVLIEGLFVSSYISTIRKFSNAVVCYRAHNIEAEIWRRVAVQEKNRFKRLYFNDLANRLEQIEISFLDKYTALIPITQRDAEVFHKYGNTKPVFVAPVTVKTDAIYHQSGENYPSVCFIGALDWIPNQEGIVWFIENVWPIVSRKKEDIQMYIAGRNAPDWLVKRLKVKNVNFLGEVDDAYQFLNQYAIMIVPLFSGSGMRVKIIEGLFLEKAIVSTSIGAEGIETTHRQNILIANTIEEFADGILELATKKEFYNEICKNARNVVIQKYDNKIITTKLVNFIGSL